MVRRPKVRAEARDASYNISFMVIFVFLGKANKRNEAGKMKMRFTKHLVLALAFKGLLMLSSATGPANAMSKNDMLMGKTLESFLSDLISLGDLSNKQQHDILRIADKFRLDSNLFGWVMTATDGGKSSYRTDAFASEESKKELRAYL